MFPTLVENYKLFCVLACSLYFVNIIIMTGKPTCATSKMVPHAPAISIIVCKVKYPLRFVVGCVQPVTQQYKLRIVRKAPLQSKQPL